MGEMGRTASFRRSPRRQLHEPPKRALGSSGFADSVTGAILRLASALVFGGLRSPKELFGATILDNVPSF